MSVPYDETFEEFERRTGLDAFFSDYSNEVRGKLLSKNLEKPKDIYDVIYPQMREDNLSKNVISSSDLEIDSQIIREALTKNLVSKQKSLEESGDLQRKRLESKNKLVESSKSLEDFAEESRKSAILKNNDISKNVDSISKVARNENFRKNSESKLNIDSFSSDYRDNLLSKNLVRDNDPYNKIASSDNQNKVDRDRNLKNNKEKITNLEIDSRTPREVNESKNLSSINDLLNDSESSRSNLILKNKSENASIESISEDIRANNNSKNLKTNNSIENESSLYRSNLLKNNREKNTNLESDSSNYKSINQSKNTDKNYDAESENKKYREDTLTKNTTKNSNLLSDSEELRANVLSKNSENKTNLDVESSQYRDSVTSKNKIVNTDLEKVSENFRSDTTSRNESKTSSLEDTSKPFRQEDLQSNVSNSNNLKNDSQEFREQDLSANKKISSNLDFDSSVYRSDDLSYNTPTKSDLESDSFPYREDDLSNNNLRKTDLESESEEFRQQDLSSNKKNDTNLFEDSIPFRNDDISSNSPIDSSLEEDSEAFRDNNLVPNVPSNSELIGDSFQYLSTSLAANLPNDSNLEEDSSGDRLNNLYSNITQPEDLGDNSIGFRANNTSNNVENDTNLLVIAKPEREDQTSSNVSNTKDINQVSKVFRNDQLAKNPSRFNLGANIILEGTSTFVGVSRLEISGAIFRATQNLLNGDKENIKSVFDDEESIDFLDETSSNQLSPGGREYLTKRNSINSLNTIEGGENIIGTYGTSLIDDTSRVDDGLGFYSSPSSVGFVTNLISLHNIQQNTFQSKPGETYDKGVQSAIEGLRNFGSAGFQELLSKTGINKRLQQRTNTTPAEVISENGGTYLADSAEKILKPLNPSNLDDSEGEITGLNMVSQTDTSDAIEQDFDKGGSRRRGVRHVIDTIANTDEDKISFAKNFNVQGTENSSSVFVLGKKKDGSYKKSYNRYSIKNPYAPEGAETLRFVLTNYSIPAIEGSAMSFPAYIESFNHGDSATWNSTSFLGRPEPIYTYGSSSRDGSVSFWVLTDFAQRVDIGYKFDETTGQVSKITESFGNKFSSIRTQDSAEADELRAEANAALNNRKRLPRIKPGTKPFTDESADYYARRKFQAEQNRELNEQAAELDEAADAAAESANLAAQRNQRFRESAGGTNIYKLFDTFSTTKKEENYVESSVENTMDKLAEMKKRSIFQPSYFSGSKVDFLKRMEFISKMTRPARNRLSDRQQSGFSFSRPPVCHLTLGDWLDHDILVSSVAYDYASSPWTFDGGKVQPMWCKVTLTFNIIGAYGGEAGEDPPLSTDVGGYFSRRVSK